MPDEMICPVCGYDPSAVPAPDALEEGTLLKGRQYQLGVMKSRTKNGILYGAFDYTGQQPLFIGEFFPADLAMRDIAGDGMVIVPEENAERFDKRKREFICSAEGYEEVFRENNTVYLVFPKSRQNAGIK